MNSVIYMCGLPKVQYFLLCGNKWMVATLHPENIILTLGKILQFGASGSKLKEICMVFLKNCKKNIFYWIVSTVDGIADKKHVSFNSFL